MATSSGSLSQNFSANETDNNALSNATLYIWNSTNTVGNMWTTDYGGNSVTKVFPNGTMTNYTGTGSGPYGIAFDGTNMWTANLWKQFSYKSFP